MGRTSAALSTGGYGSCLTGPPTGVIEIELCPSRALRSS